jgi:hypothetical protein
MNRYLHTKVQGLPVPPSAAWHAVDSCTRSASPRRSSRRDRKTAIRVAILAALGLAWFVAPVIGRAL